MNFPFHLPGSCAIALAVMLAGCGQTGPLYMPVKPAPRQTGPANTAPTLPATATPPQPVTP
ncbi:lipoprotein [Noviherbaspirillum sp. 1P10PC]|uniref:LPS translocon maturation chaperone LptM n=1 Tax=Noviherbaspirillum sp. 1P10PC TaxID=3132292 RepID=UPI0039A050BB